MEISSPIPFERRTSVRIPMVTAKVEAGFPSPADDHLERGIELNEELIRNEAATFFVRVKGDSMRDANIHSGDILIIDKSISPSDRQIVVAMVDGDFTVKRFCKRAGKIFLEAANPSFNPIEIEEGQDLVVWGVVTYIIHQAK